MKNFSLASWTIDLVSSKHFMLQEAATKTPGYSPGHIFTFWEEDAIYQLLFHIRNLQAFLLF